MTGLRRALALVPWVALLAGACTEPLPLIDTFPVTVSLDAGVPILGARAAEIGDDVVFEVVVDTASAVTVLDNGTADPRRRRVELDLLGYPIAPPVLRATFPDVPALLAGVGGVGTGAPRDVGGVIGGDVLSRVALRLDPTRRQLRFFQGVPGDIDTLADSCAAALVVTLAGGDTRYVSGNDAVAFLPSKLVIGACLGPDPAVTDTVAGGDSLLVVATGVGPTILSRTAYERAAGVDEAAVDALPEIRLYLPYDQAMNGERARAATLPRMALVGRPHRTRGPCAELQVSRILGRSDGQCTEALRNAGCPCSGNAGSDLCGAAGTVDLEDPVEVAIIEDTHPLLQALRNELRPDNAEIGGLLGMQALGPLVTDIDYPGGRVLFRCAQGQTSCIVRPRVTTPGLERVAALGRRGCFP